VKQYSTGKWYDGNFVMNGHQSLLIITLPHPVEIAAYYLLTANDPQRRDPISWTLSALQDDGTTVQVHRVEEIKAPRARNELYDVQWVSAPPPPTIP